MNHVAVPGADGNVNKQLIATLIRSRLFRDYESVFTKATGLPLTLQPLDYWQLAHHGKKNENAFCAMLAENPATPLPPEAPLDTPVTPVPFVDVPLTPLLSEPVVLTSTPNTPDLPAVLPALLNFV